MSLLSQMYPSALEAVDRRSGPRLYRPNYNLCRHLTLPEPATYYDPKPDPVRIDSLGDGVYRTSHGLLDRDLMEQFARHCQWKTNSQLNYVIHHPPYDDYTKPMPGAAAPAYLTPVENVALKSLTFPNIRLHTPTGPFEWQQVMQNTGSGQQPQLPETKSWPLVSAEHRPFPGNSFPVTKLFRKVEHHADGRTAHERERVQRYIKELAKTNDFNPQFVKPMKYDGYQHEARLYEPPKRTPGRNPPNWTSTYQAEFNRIIPSPGYHPPLHPQTGQASSTTSKVPPSCPYSTISQPSNLDDLPMPWNFSKTPHDPRLISGYEL